MRERVFPVCLVMLSVGRAHLMAVFQIKLLFSPVFIYFAHLSAFGGGGNIFFVQTNSRNLEKFSIGFYPLCWQV